MQGDLTPPEGKKCFSGIPEAHFIDDVDSHMKGEESAEAKIKELDEVHQKYKFMENSLSSRRKRLKGQVPDIKSSLAMVKKLREKKSADEKMETQFLLSDQVRVVMVMMMMITNLLNCQVYADAVIPPTDKVCLWLGANVMLEYTLDGESPLSLPPSSLLSDNISRRRGASHQELRVS